MYTLDEIIAYIAKNGADVDTDNDGQIIIYTGLRANEDNELEEIE